jgi:hypothetical protein
MAESATSKLWPHSPSSREGAAVVKRPYTSPRLEEYGRFSDLTGGSERLIPDSPWKGSQGTFFAPDRRPES